MLVTMCANFTMLCAAIFIMSTLYNGVNALEAFFSINFVSATLDLWACHIGPQLTLESRTHKPFGLCHCSGPWGPDLTAKPGPLTASLRH